MIINANAKINLALDVTGKRADGYHEVSMIMQEVGLCDKIEIIPDSTGEVKIEIENANLPSDESNIAVKAAKLFFEKTSVKDGCKIILEKHIPICAGLGGGSSDGAAVLKGLNRIYNCPLGTDELCDLGLALGADVPFFIEGKTALAKGIGEKLSKVSSKLEGTLCIIKPDIDISTPLAYKTLDCCTYPHYDIIKIKEALEKGDTNTFINKSGNVFEYVCCPLHPQIDEIKNHLKKCGAYFAMMSGSGPSVFGIFEKREDAQKAFETYKGSFGGGGVCELI